MKNRKAIVAFKEEADEPAAASNSSSPGTPRKPALKRATSATQHKPESLPKELWSHSDPVLRRLRLQDCYGDPVNLQETFRDAQIVGFLFGSEWATKRGTTALFYKEIFDYTQRNSHRFKLVYSSIDTDEEAFKRAITQKPYLLSQIWNDGSNIAIPSHEDGPVPPLANDEHFLLANDPDLEPSEPHEKPTYARPFSRAHLANKWEVLVVPTLVIYDLRTSKVINWNVGPSLVSPRRIDKTWAAWEAGESGDLTAREIIHLLRVPLGLVFFALVYVLGVVFGGDEYNFLGHLLESLFNQVNP